MANTFKIGQTNVTSALNSLIPNEKEPKIINGKDWKLSTKYQDIVNLFTNNKGQIEVLLQTYKGIANMQIPEQFSAETITTYIKKKRAAIVYICLLYLQKLDASVGSKQQEIQNQKDEIDRLNNIIKAIKNEANTFERVPNTRFVNTNTNTNSKHSSTPGDIAKFLNNIAEKLEALMAKKDEEIAKLQADLNAKTAEIKEKDGLLNKIIPFIASQTESADLESVNQLD